MSKNVYETDNMAVAAYVALRGLSHVETREGLGKGDKLRAVFVFDDAAGIGPELERDYYKSKEKHFRDLLFYFRNEAEKINRGQYEPNFKSYRTAR